MKSRVSLLVASCLLASLPGLLPSAARARPPVTASVHVGSLGIGPEVDVRIPGSNFGVRGSFNTFNFGDSDIYHQTVGIRALNRTQDVDMSYDGNIKTLNGALTGDWYPWKTGFRISAGVVISTNRLSASGAPSGSVSYLSGSSVQTLSNGQIGSVSARGRYHPVNPLFAIGFSSRLFSQLYLSGDLGVMYQGKAQIGVHSNGYVSELAPFQKAVDKARSKALEGMNKLPVYPVVMIGLGWRF